MGELIFTYKEYKVKIFSTKNQLIRKDVTYIEAFLGNVDSDLFKLCSPVVEWGCNGRLNFYKGKYSYDILKIFFSNSYYTEKL